jgi:regulator of replication initiation timing
MSDLITELHALAQRMAAAGETDEPTTVALAAEEIERLQQQNDYLSALASGQPLYGLEEKIAELMARNKALKGEVERLREERDQALASQEAAINQTRERMALRAGNRETIKQLALDCGFKLKTQSDGADDLNPYVYDFADALLEQAEENILNCIFYAPSSPVSAGAAAAIQDWWPKFKAGQQAKEVQS